MPTVTSDQRARLVRRGLHLEYFSLAYNSLEGLIAVGAGLLAGSIALVGFGFDSAIEVASSAVLLWRLRADADEGGRERVERMSLRLVGVCFLLLAAYVSYESVERLLARQASAESLPGIVLAAASLVVMPLLVRAKRRVARAISSDALAAEARQTEFCVYLSAILLAGLGVNALAGWWWADPAAAFAMTPIMAREGLLALRGRPCGCGALTAQACSAPRPR